MGPAVEAASNRRAGGIAGGPLGRLKRDTGAAATGVGVASTVGAGAGVGAGAATGRGARTGTGAVIGRVGRAAVTTGTGLGAADGEAGLGTTG
jgi:hypothetical protein